MIETSAAGNRAMNGRISGWLTRYGAPRWMRRVSLILGATLLLTILLASLLAGYISPYDPIAQDLSNMLQPPSAAHPFGTDNFGRDIFSRVLHAAKLDLMIGVLCVLFPMIVGVVFGCLAGYLGGRTDTIIMRTVDTFTAFPFLVMVIAIIAIGVSTILLAAGFARLDGHGSRETVLCMSIVLAGALVAFAIADSKS